MVIIMTINSKQRRFVEEYLVDLNATRAATRAGYSVKTARQISFFTTLRSLLLKSEQEGFVE